jgi:hypothetical protein
MIKMGFLLLGSQAHLGLKNAESQGVIAKKWG